MFSLLRPAATRPLVRIAVSNPSVLSCRSISTQRPSWRTEPFSSINRSTPFANSPDSSRHILQWKRLIHSFNNVLIYRRAPVYTGIYSHLAHFSYLSVRRLRNTYFPKSSSPGKPPRRNGFTAAINRLPSGVVLWTVLGLNGVVYLFWNVAIDRAQNHRDPSVLNYLIDNFTLSWHNWEGGRFWTVLTSCFSNQATSHILMNALTFYFMAPPVLQILGNASFLTLYLGGGIASSLITLYFNEFLLKKRRVVHGASGAIYAVISFMASTAPKATFLIFGIIPIPAWGCVAGLFTWDLVNAISERQTGVSEMSHLSGIMFGIGYFLHKVGRLPRFF